MTTLLIPYYQDKRPARHREISTCLKRNLANPLIDRVVAVCDVPCKIEPHPKLMVITLASGRRQTYNDLFRFGSFVNPDGVNIAANADIYFKPEAIKQLNKIDYTGLVVALTRWDVQGTGKPKFLQGRDSQDSWIWKGKLNVNGNYHLGIRGCDNVIAHELAKNYTVVNPSLTIKSFHLHLSEQRTYSTKGNKDKYDPPYLRVLPCYFSDKPIKKVLYVGFPGQKGLTATLKTFGKYEFFDWGKEMKKRGGILGMKQRLIELSRKFKPDFTFMQLQTPDVIDQITATKMSGYVMNWTGDCRSEIPGWMLDLKWCVDSTCFTNETDVDTMVNENCSSYFLQIGVEDAFTLKGDKFSKVPEIVFMANNYADMFPLSRERYEIAHKLHSTFGTRFQIYGRGWNPELNPTDLNGKHSEEALVYRSTKIAINSNHFIHKRFSSDRIFRIMGSGGFCLTRWYPGIEKDFIDGVHLRVFRNVDELIYLVRYYLSPENEEERKAIAAAGCALVRGSHTWMNRVAQIRQMAMFPQKKLELNEVRITKPMSNRAWRKLLKEGKK